MKKTPVIVNRSVEELIPYIRNSRTHSDAQVAQVAASIREFGWTNPVLIDGENGIIAGHCRVMAARKLDMAERELLVALSVLRRPAPVDVVAREPAYQELLQRHVEQIYLWLPELHQALSLPARV